MTLTYWIIDMRGTRRRWQRDDIAVAVYPRDQLYIRFGCDAKNVDMTILSTDVFSSRLVKQ